MIHVERGPEPKLLRDKRYTEVMRKAIVFYSAPESKRRQSRFTFPWFDRTQLVESLVATFRGHCAYCETPVTEKDATIDHFRPRANALGLQGEVRPDHYWGLVYRWSNLYLSCRRCNAAKRNLFPVKGTRAGANDTVEAIASEKRLLLDPCEDSPLRHLLFDEDGQVSGRDESGQVTAEILELNRKDLIQRRAKYAGLALDTIGPALADESPPPPTRLRKLLETALDPSQPFLGVRRSVIAQRIAEFDPQHELDDWLEFMARPADAAKAWPRPSATEKKSKAPRPRPKPKKTPSPPPPASVAPQPLKRTTQREQLHRIEITNFRAIDHLELEFPLEQDFPSIAQTSNVEAISEYTSAPWLCLLGENGCGKSTLLQAVATTLMSEAERRKLGITVKDVLRWGTKSGQVKLFFSGGGEPLSLEFNGRTGRFKRYGSCPLPMVIGYGTTRLLPRGQHRPAKPGARSHLVPLFNPFTPLVDGKKWMRQAGAERFDYASRVLKDLLQLDEDSSFTRKRKGAKVNFVLQGQQTELDTLSSGYQSLIALTTDVMNALGRQSMIMEAAEGLVLLDEIGVHLHPQWRMRVVTALRTAFPGVQFLASTHEPLCLRGLRKGEVVVMRRENARVTALTDLPPVDELRVDQLLTSEFFGLHTAMDPDMEDAFAEYYRLKAVPKAKLRTAQKERLDELTRLLDDREHLGSSRRQRLLYGAIDDFLAQDAKQTDPEQRQGKKQALTQQLRKLWEEA